MTCIFEYYRNSIDKLMLMTLLITHIFDLNYAIETIDTRQGFWDHGMACVVIIILKIKFNLNMNYFK